MREGPKAGEVEIEIEDSDFSIFFMHLDSEYTKGLSCLMAGNNSKDNKGEI